ncbi:type II toxin-antitoxin system RelE/ParE family toxin [Capnocytophaga genosp. AHN8471]|uniref:Plasmid stabilization protein ParE n=1 Tax=Capnocytophaga endodontalis TaxID=2708117 RepID=A0A1Z4BSU1_9FLAO|nr:MULTISPECIES: type II toxin-antitoxin system RelE/ParE family toxin [Capnocytophaga]ASF44279.1 plasmid stabilization protein ParE [Capnocytophaga endodontalis]MBM0653938.1 type II toxin-antitoxin system RelE/ParE family toxin [Capnocytophaga genosp. AHN8471]
MELFWTNNAIDNLDETLTYWIRRNKSNAYSEKIAVAVAKAEKEIKENPYRSDEYSERLKTHRKALLDRKFSIFYEIDEERNIILITYFRSAKQKPLF